MSTAQYPILKKFMDEKLSVKLNADRHVQGVLRGFDPFMNIVLDDCIETMKDVNQKNIGMVVIRGNSIVKLEPLEQL